MKRIQDETNKIENENEIAQTPSNEGQNQKEPEEILDMVVDYRRVGKYQRTNIVT